MRRLKDDNSGLSLIEVLVAMIILAIVVTPFLHSFFTTANANAKAKKIHKATTVAQSVMEGIKAESVEGIAKQFNYPGANWRITSTSAINGGANLSGHVAELSYDATSNSYSVVKKYEDVPAGVADKKSLVTSSAYSEDGGTNVEFLPNASGVYYYAIDTLKEDKSTYDVLVKLDTTSSEATTYNNQALVQLPILDEEKDAICIEKLSYLQNAMSTCGVADATGLKRKITISVDCTHLGGGGGDRTRVKVTYYYANISDSSKNFTKEVTCYDSTESSEELRSIYLYYTPIYPVMPERDQIEYINDNNIPVNLYVLKQKNDSTTSGLLVTSTALEEGYKMQLLLKSSAVTQWADCDTTLYTNLNQDMANNNANIPSVSRQYQVTFNGNSINIDSNGLTSSSNGTRVFDMTVSIYEGGARTENFPASKLLTTIDSNKLN